MKLIKKILISFLALVVLIAVVGFFILPAVVHPVLIDKISVMLHRQTSIERIKINPFALSVTIQGFKLTDPGQKMSLLSFGELYVNADLLTSLVRRAIILEEIRLDSPFIGITRKLDGTYNFSDLISEQKSETQKKETNPLLFSLNNIQITHGAIDFHDLPLKTNHTVRDLSIAVPFVSNLDYYMKNYVEPKFSAVVNGHTLNITGQTQPFQSSRETRFNIDMRNIDLPFYLQYAPVQLNFKLTKALLDTQLQMSFLLTKGKSPELKLSGQISLTQLAMDDLRGNKILRIPRMTFDLASVEPFTRKVHFSLIALDAPQLIIRRNKQGKLNLSELIKAEQKEKSALPDTKPASSAKEVKALTLSVDRTRIDKAHIAFIDAQPAAPVNIVISPLSLAVSNFSLQPENLADLDLSLVMNRKTKIAAKGTFGVTPLAANLAVDVKNLFIRPFQPYFTEAVRVDVTRGAISTDGNFLLAVDAEGKPRIKYAGQLAIRNLATIDKATAHDFLKWKNMNFRSLAVGYNPLFVKIEEISLIDFFTEIVIHPGGVTNLQNIFAKEEKETTDSQPPKPGKTSAPPPNIQIGSIRLQGGTVDFADRNIQPPYTATLLNLQGSVTGLSSQEISRASVAIQGNLGYGSPVEISGRINPLKKDLFADVKIQFKDVEMSPTSPYTGRYLGYPITKGKLTFQVDYLVDQRKLNAENKIFFDQLTFGDPVESPDAIKAPVPLAASLLTDRNGQIHLDIPLSGSLDDPEFKIWPLVWQILGNLITKAVTSPFSLLSTLTGGGEEMSFVEFDYGSSRPAEAELKKIAALAKALYNRPNLKMEIEGYVDLKADREALKKAEFDRLLKIQKMKDLIDKDKESVTLSEVTISREEYEKYLTLAYKAADISKPRNLVGIAKTLPPADMEKRLREAIVISDNDLAQLASLRARHVLERLIKDGKLEPARLFLVKSPSLSPERKEKIKDSRVCFQLK